MPLIPAILEAVAVISNMVDVLEVVKFAFVSIALGIVSISFIIGMILGKGRA